MKKKYKYTDRSNKIRCKRCGRGIKIRLIEIKLNTPEYCYKCYKGMY